MKKRTRKKRRTNTYSIMHINCDCATYDIARPSWVLSRYIIGPKCECCKKQLGFMQWSVMGEVKAKGELEALKLYREGQTQ